MVVSSGFGDGILKRRRNWRKAGHCHYTKHRATDATTIVEIRRGVTSEDEGTEQ